MNLGTIVWQEIRQRPAALAGSLLAISLGVAALVAICHLTAASEAEVSRHLSALGANVLILPQAASVEDYYAADLHDKTLPEEHVAGILLANLPGVEKLSPKLCVRTELEGKPITLTGILPQREFEASTAWQTVTMFGKNEHVGCKRAHSGPSAEELTAESLAAHRTLMDLGTDEILLGADVAKRTGMKVGSRTKLYNSTFKVAAVLPPSGTIDDSRVFAHLHTVQDLAGTGPVVSAIEVLGCCEDAAGGLVPQLSELMPDARVTTISNLVQTQVGVNRLLSKISWCVLAVLVVAGGLSVASTIAGNVRERRREIGTLMALGAKPSFVSSMFILKALALGVVGGTLGATIGMLAAMWGGPSWAGIAVDPLPTLLALSILVAAFVSLTAAWWPARQAAKLDPCSCFQEC